MAKLPVCFWPLTACLLATAATSAVAQQDDPRLLACKRPGWVFLPGVQQQSWQAIMNCNPYREPAIQCAKDKECFAWTSNGNEGSGWLYRLPRVKQCGSSSSGNSLQGLEWEWSWSWVKMNCLDRGPCCGTYVAHDTGPNPSFTVSCSDGAGPARSRDCQCPKLLLTHEFFTPEQFDVECSRQKADAGGSQGKRRLAASPGAEAARRQYLALISKTPTAGPQSEKQSFIKKEGTGQCLNVALTCGTLAKP